METKNVIRDINGQIIYTPTIEIEAGEIRDVINEAVSNHVCLSYAQLTHQKLTFMELQGVNLSHARFNYARLNYSDLSNSNLEGANFKNANLLGVDFSGANLTGANFSGANLNQVMGLNYASCCFAGHGESGRQLLAVEINYEIRLFCGCFSGTKEELIDFIERGADGLKESRFIALETVLKLIKIKRQW